jgi:DNA-binding transcriptional ArsR family regulator
MLICADNRIRKALSPDALASVAKVLGDERRIALLRILADGKEHCVCHLAEKLDLPEFQTSRQLALLRRLGLVVARREGTWMHYHACAEACAPVLAAFAALLSPRPFTGGSGEAGCCITKSPRAGRLRSEGRR